MVIAESSINHIINAIQKSDSTSLGAIVAAQTINWTMTVLICGGLIGAFLLFLLWWDKKKRQENINQASDKALVEFGMRNGHVKFVLCDEHMGEITVEDGGGTKKKYDGVVKAPKDLGSIKDYYILEDHGYIIDYPLMYPGKKPAQQTQIMLYHFNENDPSPKFPRHPEQWNTEKYAKLTSSLIEMSKEQSNLQAIVAEVSGAFKPLVTAAKIIALIPQIRLLIFILMGLVAIDIIVGYLTMSNVGVVKNFIIGTPVPPTK
jgi:hypothetical protein